MTDAAPWPPPPPPVLPPPPVCVDPPALRALAGLYKWGQQIVFLDSDLRLTILDDLHRIPLRRYAEIVTAFDQLPELPLTQGQFDLIQAWLAEQAENDATESPESDLLENQVL